ncbi:DegT/DnrJ/EryC1/StrS family aminotransferase [Steroidobacter cummioxidans]|uniref:DegT/DnrJ/EryC1/StrS family aminotransferase n=1 Tax=Steroidobacter cummioxidans TaxID=1803913 RepID=UPI000E321148|nr:DegT/DnrJ/EryC1/StrS family aminotransferase [Steroidobacter cummioxidans]
MAFVAPAGTPISPLTFAVSLARGMGSSAQIELGEGLAAHAGHGRYWLISTGRAAMVLALQAMRDVTKDPQRMEVIVPAYTCYSVPASVIKAGLKPRLCDVDPSSLSLDPQALRKVDFSRVLAVVTANLYGIPNHLRQIEAIAREHGVWMLDDSAQALGATHEGRPVGGFGDVGLYSFDKGKNITSLEGGALVASHPELSAALDRRHSALLATSATRTATTIVKLAAYATLLRPTLYGVVRKLPGLGLGRTVYDETYPVERYSGTLAGFAATLLKRLPELTRGRRDKAAALQAELRNVPGVRLIDVPQDSQPAYARYPFLMTDAAQRATVLEKLEAAGIGATASYPSALCDVPEVAASLPESDRDMPGAREVANTIVTLPTHSYSPTNLPNRIGHVLRDVLR